MFSGENDGWEKSKLTSDQSGRLSRRQGKRSVDTDCKIGSGGEELVSVMPGEGTQLTEGVVLRTRRVGEKTGVLSGGRLMSANQRKTLKVEKRLHPKKAEPAAARQEGHRDLKMATGNLQRCL